MPRIALSSRAVNSDDACGVAIGGFGDGAGVGGFDFTDGGLGAGAGARSGGGGSTTAVAGAAASTVAFSRFAAVSGSGGTASDGSDLGTFLL